MRVRAKKTTKDQTNLVVGYVHDRRIRELDEFEIPMDRCQKMNLRRELLWQDEAKTKPVMIWKYYSERWMEPVNTEEYEAIKANVEADEKQGIYEEKNYDLTIIPVPSAIIRKRIEPEVHVEHKRKKSTGDARVI